MAANKYTGTYGDYYANDDLNASQQEANVLYIGKYLLKEGWTLNAIAGLCGNIQSECGFNPGLEEVGEGTGYGLIQWTPGTIHSGWCKDNGYEDVTSMDANLAHIAWEAENESCWYKKESDGYDLSFKEFTTSTKSPYFLAGAFCWNRERPAVSLWGFHRGMNGEPYNDVGIDDTSYHVVPPHNDRTYCKKTDYDDPVCAEYCVAYKYCYHSHFGEDKTRAQVIKNKENLEKTRGDQADTWFNFLLKNLFQKIPAPGEAGSESVYKRSYYVSKYGGFSGLNYNYSIEKWPPNGCGETDEHLKKLGILGTGTVLPNCTSWAWGRAYEIMGEEPPIFAGDAGCWYEYFNTLNAEGALEAKGYSRRGKDEPPVLGAIACWAQKSDPSTMGHVAIVEEIHDDGEITISESGWGQWEWGPCFYRVRKLNPADYSDEHDFQGYIVLPGYSWAVTEPTIEIESFTLKETSTEEASFSISIKDDENAISSAYYSLNRTKKGTLTLSASTKSFTIKNLVPNTAYSIIVTLESETENIISNAVAFMTKQDYPDAIKDIKIESTTGKNLETTDFKVSIEAPSRWGYWKTTAKNDYGYKVFIVEDSRLLSNFDSVEQKTLTIKPASKNVSHEKNFQVGISTWVTDNNGTKIFAEPGKDYPVCSNSVYLKDPSESSDSCFIITDNKVYRTRLFIRDNSSNSFKPLNIFKI